MHPPSKIAKAPDSLMLAKLLHALQCHSVALGEASSIRNLFFKMVTQESARTCPLCMKTETSPRTAPDHEYGC